MCKLELPGCKVFSQCVDHIQAVTGPSDPLFWVKSNHQAACLRCNTVKGKKTIVGTGGVKME
jgi:5-methylcytosine-specific restriction protein A